MKPKVKLSLDEIVQKLLGHYRQFADVFSPDNAAKLLPYRLGMDHELPLEQDEYRQDKQVP